MREMGTEEFDSQYFSDLLALWWNQGFYSQRSAESFMPAVGLGKTTGKMLNTWISMFNKQAHLHLSLDIFMWMHGILNDSERVTIPHILYPESYHRHTYEARLDYIKSLSNKNLTPKEKEEFFKLPLDKKEEYLQNIPKRDKPEGYVTLSTSEKEIFIKEAIESKTMNFDRASIRFFLNKLEGIQKGIQWPEKIDGRDLSPLEIEIQQKLKQALPDIDAEIQKNRINPANFCYRNLLENVPPAELQEKLDFSNGNGTIMNLVMIIFYAPNVFKAMEWAYAQSIVTTPGQQSAHFARLLTFLFWKGFWEMPADCTTPQARTEWLLRKEHFQEFMKIEQVLPTVTSQYLEKGPVPLDPVVAEFCRQRAWDVPINEFKIDKEILEYQGGTYVGSYAKTAMELVLNLLRNTDSMDMLLGTAVLAKGDADSVASIAAPFGAIVHGFTGPRNWIDCVNRFPMNPRQILPAKLGYSYSWEELGGRDRRTFLGLQYDAVMEALPASKGFFDRNDSELLKQAQFTQDGDFIYLDFDSSLQKTVDEMTTRLNIPSYSKGYAEGGHGSESFSYFPQPQVISGDKIRLRMENSWYEKNLLAKYPEICPTTVQIQPLQIAEPIFPIVRVYKINDKKNTHFLMFEGSKEQDNYTEALIFASFFSNYPKFKYLGKYKGSFPLIQPYVRDANTQKVGRPLVLQGSGQAIFPMDGDRYIAFRNECRNFPDCKKLPMPEEVVLMPEDVFNDLAITLQKLKEAGDIEENNLPEYSEVSPLKKAIQEEKTAIQADQARPQKAVPTVPKDDPMPAPAAEQPKPEATKPMLPPRQKWKYQGFGNCDWLKMVKTAEGTEVYLPSGRGLVIYANLEKALEQCTPEERAACENLVKIKPGYNHDIVLFSNSDGTLIPGTMIHNSGCYSGKGLFDGINCSYPTVQKLIFTSCGFDHLPVSLRFLGEEKQGTTIYVHPELYSRQVKKLEEIDSDFFQNLLGTLNKEKIEYALTQNRENFIPARAWSFSLTGRKEEKIFNDLLMAIGKNDSVDQLMSFFLNIGKEHTALKFNLASLVGQTLLGMYGAALPEKTDTLAFVNRFCKEIMLYRHQQLQDEQGWTVIQPK